MLILFSFCSLGEAVSVWAVSVWAVSGTSEAVSGTGEAGSGEAGSVISLVMSMCVVVVNCACASKCA